MNETIERIEESLEFIKQRPDDPSLDTYFDDIHDNLLDIKRELNDGEIIEAKKTWDKLKRLGEKLHLGQSNITQDEILDILSYEFNINLITAPQKYIKGIT